MLHIIEKNLFRPAHFEALMDAILRLGIDHEVVRYVPFSRTIEFETDRKDVWVWGSINHPEVYAQYGWAPAVLNNPNHDFSVYAPRYGNEHMLNGDGTEIRLGDPLPFDWPRFFARPLQDNKLFTGQVFARDDWEAYVEGVREKDLSDVLDAGILLAPLKPIEQEVRCWVVGGRVVTASSYKSGDRAFMTNYDDERLFVDFAQHMADRFCPAEAFVIDVCLTGDKLKVVEVNCINAAGFYKANLPKLLEAIERHFGNRESGIGNPESGIRNA